MVSSQARHPTAAPDEHRRLVPARAVVLVYVAAGVLWILGSGPVADRFADSTAIPRLVVELGKGVLFVAVTALVLQVVLRRRAVRLDASEDRNRLQATALSSTANAVVITRPDGTIEWVNAAFESMSGYPSAVAVGADPSLLSSGAHDQAFFEELWETILAGGVWHGQVVNRRSDGALYTVSQTITPVVAEDGAVQYFVAMHEDITARIRAEDQLEASRLQLQALFDHALDAIVLADDHGRYLAVNPAACELTGFSQHDLLAMGASDLAAPEQQPAEVATQFDDFVQAGTDSGSFALRHRDGHVIQTEYRAVSNIQPGVHLSVLRDVTARLDMTRALERALDNQLAAAEQLRMLNAMKDTFLQSVSHELRTPLTAILGFAQLLADPDHELSPEGIRGFHERIVNNARRLQRLLDDLLDVDRLSRGHIEPDRQPTDLTALIERMVLDTELGDHPVDLDLEPITMDLDGPWIERLVANLLRNIVRHTPPETRIWIRTRAANDGVELTVEDDGPGIPEDDRQRVIEPFQQGSEVAASAQPGTGVGLSLVRTFARIHGGDLSVTDSPTGGTRMTVTLAHLPADGRQGGPSL